MTTRAEVDDESSDAGVGVDDAVDEAATIVPTPRAMRAGSEPEAIDDRGGQLDLVMPYLHAMARRLTGNAHDASDLVQDALVRALRAPSLPPGTDLRPWLATIVRHLHVDRIRQLAREPLPVPLDEASADSLTVPEETGKDESAAGGRVDHLAQLEHALTELPEEFRRVFVLYALEGRSYRDIADSLGIPMATVGTRLSRARLKLRGLLEAAAGAARVAVARSPDESSDEG